jgi:hypothetical protein
MKVGDAESEQDTNGICFMLEVTEYFKHKLSGLQHSPTMF